jgi:hypothetical protein
MARLVRARSLALPARVFLVAVGLALASVEACWAADGQSEKPLKSALRGMMSQIDANELAAWEEDDSHTVSEPDTRAYKVVRTDGSIEFVDERPASSDGVSRLYSKQNPEGYALVMTNQGRVFMWERLYWYPDKQKWTRPHPNVAAFQREESLVEQFLSKLTHGIDAKAGTSIPILVSSIKRSREPGGAEQDRAKLSRLLNDIGRGWGGIALLNQVYDLNIRIGHAAIDEKLALARQRRALLKRLVGLINR